LSDTNSTYKRWPRLGFDTLMFSLPNGDSSGRPKV
jgi:hypothetical protein